MGTYEELICIPDIEVAAFQASAIRAQAMLDAQPKRAVFAMSDEPKHTEQTEQIDLDAARAAWAPIIARVNASRGPDSQKVLTNLQGVERGGEAFCVSSRRIEKLISLRF